MQALAAISGIERVCGVLPQCVSDAQVIEADETRKHAVECCGSEGYEVGCCCHLGQTADYADATCSCHAGALRKEEVVHDGRVSSFMRKKVEEIRILYESVATALNAPPLTSGYMSHISMRNYK